MLKIILKISNKRITYTRAGETDDINKHFFIMVLYCAATIPDLPEDTGCSGWGELAPLT